MHLFVDKYSIQEKPQEEDTVPVKNLQEEEKKEQDSGKFLKKRKSNFEVGGNLMKFKIDFEAKIENKNTDSLLKIGEVNLNTNI